MKAQRQINKLSKVEKIIDEIILWLYDVNEKHDMDVLVSKKSKKRSRKKKSK